jgi:hypothetical protein
LPPRWPIGVTTFRLVVGDSACDGTHGGVLLPDALRWL